MSATRASLTIVYTAPAGACILLGGLSFCGVERFLGMRKREKPQLSAMLLDYISESLALGGMFALGAPQARLQRHWGPTLGAIVGFTVGMLGHLYV